MASETCTAMVIRQDFKIYSPLQSIFESSSTDQSISDTSISILEYLTYVVQPISAAKPESSLQTALYTLINKYSLTEPVLEPAPKPLIDISNMDISNFDDEDGLFIDGDLGSFSTFVNEPNLDTPSSSTTQPYLDLPSISSPQTINVSPPPTLLLESIVLKEVCENICEDVNKHAQARNNPVHTKNYEDKWIALREMLDRVFCDLQRLYVET